MSRIGLQPVAVPKGVTVAVVNENSLHVKGAKGELSQSFVPVVDFSISDGEVTVNRRGESKKVRAMHGLYRALLFNMVHGVSQGYTKTLIINGVGYRAEINGKTLLLNLGYSNPVEYVVPDGIEVSVVGNNTVKVSGIEKSRVGQAAAEIRRIRPPEPYKGKGIRYENEYVRRKVGKSGVK